MGLKELRKGQVLMQVVIGLAIVILLVAAVVPVLVGLGSRVSVTAALQYLAGQGYVAYADDQGILHVEGLRISGSPPMVLEGDAKSWIEFRPDLDATKIARNTKPTTVERGIVYGYSLPVGGEDEELFYNICVPDRWDGESDIHVHTHVWLDTAQDESNDAVKLQLDWAHTGIGDLAPATYNTVTDERVVGVVGQYEVVEFNFTIDYDIDVGNPVGIDDTLFFRLTRIASSHEIVGEPIIFHVGVIFRCDKYGNPSYD